MDHGVDAPRSHHVCDDWIADIGAYEIAVAEVVTRWNYVKPDYLDILAGGERASEPGTQGTGDSGDEDNPLRGHQGPAAELLARATALDPCALEQFAMLL